MSYGNFLFFDVTHDRLAHMNTRYVIGVVAIVIVLAGGAYWYTQVTPDTVKSTEETFALAEGESIASWDFKGLYTGNTELEKKAQTDIVRLNGMFGTEGNTDYMLYVSIAGQYELLGDGAKEYEYLLRALAEDSKTTGLAWYNLGTLLVRLGALESARIAYTKASSAQPHVDQYPTRLLEFLTTYFPKDEKAIEEAYAGAKAVLGEQPTLLEMHARWLEGVGRTREAIVDWKKIRELSPGSVSAVNSELRRLEGEL